MNYRDFEQAVKAAGLQPRKCQENHWQIREGRRVVNVWPETRRGFRFSVDGGQGRGGSLAQAIEEAGPPPSLAPLFSKTKSEQPPWESRADVGQHVGIIRRLWRWLW